MALVGKAGSVGDFGEIGMAIGDEFPAALQTLPAEEGPNRFAVAFTEGSRDMHWMTIDHARENRIRPRLKWIIDDGQAQLFQPVLMDVFVTCARPYQLSQQVDDARFQLQSGP